MAGRPLNMEMGVASGAGSFRAFAGRSLARRLLTVGLCLVGTVGCSSIRNAAWQRNDECSRLAQEARSAQEQGDFSRAQRLLSQALKKNPDDATARRELAELLVADGRPDLAVLEFEHVLSRNPADISTRLRLAEMYLEQRDLDEAERLAEVLLVQDRHHVEGMLLKARIAQVDGRVDTALEQYHRVLQEDSDHVQALLATAHIHLIQEHPERAAPILRGLIHNPRATEDEVADARRALGAAYAKCERWPDAVSTLGRVCGCEHATADDHYQLAYAESRLGMVEQSRHSIESALALDPAHADSLDLASRLPGTLSPSDSRAAIVHTGHEEPAGTPAVTTVAEKSRDRSSR